MSPRDRHNVNDICGTIKSIEFEVVGFVSRVFIGRSEVAQESR